MSLLLLASAGCSSLFGRAGAEDSKDERLNKLLTVPEPPELIREAAIPNGLVPIRIDGVAVVNGLPGTGGPALPSSFRDMLLEEMKHNDIADPNKYLERSDTALVQVRGLIPIGARRGDTFDLQILTPPKTEATDLHGGWLLDTRLRHQQVLQNAVRSSDVMAIGTGPVVTRRDYDGTDDLTLQVQGTVLSGGLVQSDRKLGLILRPKFQHVKMSAALAAAINRRFYFFDGSTRRGIAKPIEDDFIELEVQPRYRRNEPRLMEVVRALGVAPESSSTQARLVQLAEQLRIPSQAADAALQLEGLGEGAIPTLIEATKQTNPELRFYASEALAYLDHPDAITPLVDAIKSEPAFRAPSLEALRGMQHQRVVEGLQSLMNEPSLETRYGAFVAMRERADAKRVLAGENLRGAFRLYTSPSTASPAVVVSLRDKPEIVLMGDLAPLKIETYFLGPTGLMVKRIDGSNRLKISRFRPGNEDAYTEVDNTIASVLRGITDVGGVYGDAIAFLRMAKTSGALVDQLAFDPLPKSQRIYHRDEWSDDLDDASSED